MLSREVSFYLDSEGEIIDCWANPFNGLKQRVVHVYNDPVNFKSHHLTFEFKATPFHGSSMLI